MADSIQFHGQEKITKWLNQVLKEAGDYSKLMHNIGSILEHNTKQHINTGIGTDDKPWQKSWRAKMQGGTTLRDTSRLYNSIKYTVLDCGRSVIVGTNVFYAPVMHFGSTIRAKSGKYLKFKITKGGWAQIQSVIIPARPFLGMSVDDSQEVLFEIEEHLLELLMNAKCEYFALEPAIVERLKDIEGILAINTLFSVDDMLQVVNVSPSLNVIYVGDQVDESAGRGRSAPITLQWLIVLAVQDASA